MLFRCTQFCARGTRKNTLKSFAGMGLQTCPGGCLAGFCTSPFDAKCYGKLWGMRRESLGWVGNYVNCPNSGNYATGNVFKWTIYQVALGRRANRSCFVVLTNSPAWTRPRWRTWSLPCFKGPLRGSTSTWCAIGSELPLQAAFAKPGVIGPRGRSVMRG